MESFEDGIVLARNSGSVSSLSSEDSYVPGTFGSEVTALNDKVFIAGMNSLRYGIIDGLSITHLVVVSAVPNSVVDQVWSMYRIQCNIVSPNGLYEALPKLVGYIEMISHDVGGTVLILSDDGDRRGAAIGIAFTMKTNGWRLQWAIHRMLIRRRTTRVSLEYAAAVELWEKNGCPTVV